MRMCVGNTTVPSSSPEKPPAASYATGRRSSPVSLADARALPVSVVAEAGASLGRAASWAAPARIRGPPFLRAGPTAAVIYFLILFALLFHRIVLLFKNM